MGSLTMSLQLICFRIKNITIKLLSSYIMILALLFITLISLVSVNYLVFIHYLHDSFIKNKFKEVEKYKNI